jgi:hypothetical protein
MDSPTESKEASEIYTVYEDVEEDPDISLQYKIESFRKYENGLADSGAPIPNIVGKGEGTEATNY